MYEHTNRQTRTHIHIKLYEYTGERERERERGRAIIASSDPPDPQLRCKILDSNLGQGS